MDEMSSIINNASSASSALNSDLYVICRNIHGNFKSSEELILDFCSKILRYKELNVELTGMFFNNTSAQIS